MSPHNRAAAGGAGAIWRREYAVDFEAELTRLAEPIEPGDPCGVSLDGTQALAAIDARRIFGQIQLPASEPDWRALRSECLASLGTSKDLRVLAHLVAATIRVDPLPHALRLLTLAGQWLDRYWDGVHPRVDDDAIMRRNALEFFADRLGIVDALRRAPIVKDPQLGAFSLRDFEIGSGLLAPSEAQGGSVSLDQINAALVAAVPGSLAEIDHLTAAANSAFESMEATMLSRGGGSIAVPKLDPLVQALRRVRQILAPHVAQAQSEATGGADSPVGTNSKPAQVGVITSRQDVVRALDAVAGYYRNNEPGSLVPVIAERAKRLVSMSFIEALAEIAPETVEPVKKAAGVREKSA